MRRVAARAAFSPARLALQRDLFDDYCQFPRLKVRPAIPFVPALELYSQVILPRLADGPKTLAALGVPLSAMNHLERAGLVKSERETVVLTTGKLAIQVWY